jgi:putative acetyltransferase
VRAAFVRHPDEVTLLVERIRASENHVPELELVAEDATGVAGFVLVSWTGLDGAACDRILNLSPLAVRPDRQLQGIGAALTREALRRVDAMGEPAVMLEGIPAYYPRFGFERASALGYVPPSATIPDEAFMVKRFAGWTPEDAGRIVYPEAFAHLSPP